MGDIRFLLNGQPMVLENPDPTLTVLDWLREAKHLTGTKEGCNEGDCGACSVSLAAMEDGRLVHRAVNSCILFLPHLHGKSLTTVEGISPNGKLHPVQQAMVEHHGSQCGFCTPGIVMSLYAAHREGRQDHNDVLAGNLCRCTGYVPIQRAAEAAAKQPQPEFFDEAAALQNLTLTNDAIDGAYLPTDLDDFANWYVKNPNATLIAGATEVGLEVTKALKDLTNLAFLNRLDALKTIANDDNGIRIGAGVTLSQLRSAMVGKHTDFVEMLRRFGSVQVRNTGTIGGNIANGSPIADSPPALIAMGASITLRRGDKQREILLEDFYLSYGVQDRQPGEFVESLFIPNQPDTVGIYKISKRFDQDISAVCGGFSITIENDKITNSIIAFGGMAATSKRAKTVEAALNGQPWSEATIKAAMQKFADDFTPLSDVRGTADYRLKIVQNLLWRYWLARNGTSANVLAEVAK
ncbi:MAG: xanthine dehydrogenase small subunit [Rhodobacteraceae bacterium]|nr:xanthine dehydrogenase small subunit [Paracoccaceae bacterium]